MSRRYNIRWRESDEQELKRVVRNFNDKIRRLEKNFPENKSALPERVSVRQMKELISTRRDLNRELNSLRRFSVRGAEEIVEAPDNDYNLKMTKWQKKEMILRAAIINRKRANRLKDIESVEMTSAGKKLGYTKGQFGMGKAEEVALKPMKAFNPSMGRADLKKKYEYMIKASQDNFFDIKDERLRRNFINSLDRNFPEGKIEDVKKRIEEMDFSEFYNIFKREVDPFEDSYPGTDEEIENNATKLRATWLPNK